MSRDENFYSNALKLFQDITKKSTQFLQVNESLCNEIQNNLKEIYDFTKHEEIKNRKSNALPELIIKNFDLEQIWQQIELQNDTLIGPALTRVSRLVVNRSGLMLGGTEKEIEEENKGDNENKDLLDQESNDRDSVEKENEDNGADTVQGDEDYPSENEEMEDIDASSSDSEKQTTNDKSIKKRKQSVVDDDFFKLDEMEKFLEAEEKKINNLDSGHESEDSESEESVDLFEENDSDSDKEMEQAKYKDFFVEEESRRKSQNKHLKEIEEEDEDEEFFKSSYELKQHRLNKKIEELEEEALEEKSWQLKGEITADNRPQNSLLQEIVDFDLSTRPAPIITEQTTMQLEDIIKQRIKDKAFDSVERKAKPTETPLEYKKKLVLDQEKSKESLAQIYEKEYLEQQANLNKDLEVEEKEPELHKEINKLMKDLFIKLDALSNFHFTPKPAIPDLKIVSNLPAVSMEEVAPVATSDAALLAPEEIKSKTKGDIIGKNERTSTDKKRERRKKKIKQKIHAAEKQKKEQMSKRNTPGLGNKYSKQKMKNLLDKVSKDNNVDMIDSSDTKTMKSSKAFFSQLEDQVKSEIKRKSFSKSNKKDSNVPSAKKLKL